MRHFESRQEKLDRHFRKVEAMIRKGFDLAEIQMACPELTNLDIRDIDQRIFVNDLRKKGYGY